MKTSSAKAKGRLCAAQVKEKLHRHCTGLQPDDILITSSGSTGEDLKLSPAARSVYPFTIECKNVERLNIWDAIAQAEGHKEAEQNIPVVCFRRNRSEIYITMKLDDFLNFSA